MPHYRYEAKMPSGQTTSGMLVADNAVAAAQILRSKGNQVLQLAPASGSDQWKEKFKALNASTGPSQRDILNFTTQLAVMVRAGINLRSAVEGIAEQTENPKFKQILYQIKSDIESGKQFSEALTRHPKQYGPLYVNMVKASEMSGSFSKMLDRIAASLAFSLSH